MHGNGWCVWYFNELKEDKRRHSDGSQDPSLFFLFFLQFIQIFVQFLFEILDCLVGADIWVERKISEILWQRIEQVRPFD